jgi:hypothetical protein
MSTLREAAEKAREATDRLLAGLDRYKATESQPYSKERTAERTAAREEMFRALRAMPFSTFEWVWNELSDGVSDYPRMLEQIEEV